VFGLRPATAQLGPEKSAGCGSGSVFQIECHALIGIPELKKNLAMEVSSDAITRPVEVLWCTRYKYR
jgi:hypothetical protein